MKKCMLCGKRFNSSESDFGLSCLKKVCLLVGIEDIKNYKGEKLLNKKICKILGKKNLPNTQSKLLTNRYLALSLLNEVPLDEYDKYRKAIKNDIDQIDVTTVEKDLKSFKKITLKEASEVNKKYKKYKNVFQKIKDGDYDSLQNISFDIIYFAFSMYYIKKPYLSDMIQKLQYYILKAGVLYLKDDGKSFAADLLEHSLEKDPGDMIVTKGKAITKIKNNHYFKEKIDKIITKNNSKKVFKVKNKISFKTGDLFYALHNATIVVEGTSRNEYWYLDVIITDIYDFTDLKELEEYFNSSLASFANNFAMFATSTNVVHTYNITIKFKMEVSRLVLI